MELRRQQVRLLADSYAEAGLVPVIDDVVDRAMLDLYRKYLRLRPLRYVLLVPQLAVAHARNAGRERSREALTMEMLARFDEELRSTMDGAGLRLDTSSLTADETADQILGHLSEAVAFA